MGWQHTKTNVNLRRDNRPHGARVGTPAQAVQYDAHVGTAGFGCLGERSSAGFR
jgi:hypothetical protein